MSLNVEDITSCSSTHESDDIVPHKEYLTFEIDETDFDEAELKVIRAIKEVAEKTLYHWKNFPVRLPIPPAPFDHGVAESDRSGNIESDAHSRMRQRRASPRIGGVSSSKIFNLRDLFIVPSFDELQEVALNSHNEPKHLTYANLDSIQNSGEFEVDSVRFPGHVHRWKLSQILQKGRMKTRETLFDDLSLALSFIVIKARDSFLSSESISVKNGISSLLIGVFCLLDGLIGLPKLSSKDLEEKLIEERAKYLTIELTARPGEEDDLFDFCEFVKDASVTLENVGCGIQEDSVFPNFWSCSEFIPKSASVGETVLRSSSSGSLPKLPYSFYTPRNTEIDLRLFDRGLISKASSILQPVLESETKGWFLHFKEQQLAEFRDRKVSDDQVEKEVNTAIMDEYLKRVFARILSSEQLHALGKDVPELLTEHAKSIVWMCRAVDNMNEAMQTAMEEMETRLVNSYLLLSRIKKWMEEKLREAEELFIKENQWSAHEEALNLCREHGLHQTAYFLSRDLTFMRDRRPVLSKELECLRKPVLSFEWGLRLWATKQWKVYKRVKPGLEELVPTAFSSNASPSLPTRASSKLNTEVYRLEREIKFTSSSRYPGWRLLNLILRTFVYTNNAVYFFGILIPLMSPVGLRALFSVEPFVADHELNQENGLLFPKTENRTPTFTSRLIHLWRHVGRARSQFELEPDMGFLGKTYARHLNRFWNYFLKGILGTVVLVLCFPLLCFCVSIGSLAMAVPVLVVLAHVGMLLVYDWDAAVAGPSGATTVLSMAETCRRGGRKRDGDESRKSTLKQRVGEVEVSICDTQHNVWFRLCESVLWRIIICGVIQPAFAIVFGCLVYPFIAMIIACEWSRKSETDNMAVKSAERSACIRWAFRSGWDALMFHWLIKRHGQIPSKDSWVAKRIAGPGLVATVALVSRKKNQSENRWFFPLIERREMKEKERDEKKQFYFQIQPPQALAALEACLLWEELVTKFLDKCLLPFSGSVSREVGTKLKELQLERDEALTSVLRLMDRRRDDVRLGLSSDVRPRVRMSQRDLSACVLAAAELCRRWYEERIWRRARRVDSALGPAAVTRKGSFRAGAGPGLGIEDDFWVAKGLPVGDWIGLAAHLLSEIFSEEILCFLDDDDVRFQLGMLRTSDLSRYYELVSEAELKLDRSEEGRTVLPIHGCKRNIFVASPNFDVANFNPSPSVGGPAKRPTMSRRKRDSLTVSQPSTLVTSSVMGTALLPGFSGRKQLRYSGENLAIPLPIPHPLVVAMSIYNRDGSDPISLEEPSVRAILSRIGSAGISVKTPSANTTTRSENT
ncbi:unnamed protein product [Notodromas monacha]|uniref:Uncharacterized protein n=1 Tax=Notodromas monacha TaxID=399045 RepID=A0A7R9GI03_9CRUS|nr:unnamed protein product [Notodromas monacha]CAG0922066.1 unnamed protein product [Notodromas monacha]